MGTRFLASAEMAISGAWKRMLLAAESRDARHAEFLDCVLPPFNRPHYRTAARVLPTAFEREWAGRSDELGGHAQDLGELIVAEVLNGGGEQYVPFAGQSVGLVHDIQPAAEIVRNTVAEATRILADLSRVGLQVDYEVPCRPTRQPSGPPMMRSR